MLCSVEQLWMKTCTGDNIDDMTAVTCKLLGDDFQDHLGAQLSLLSVSAATSPVTDDVQTLLENRTIRFQLFQLYLTVLLHCQHVCFLV